MPPGWRGFDRVAGDGAGRSYQLRGGWLGDEVRDFDPSPFGLNPREARDLDPQQRLLLRCSREAFDAAGVAPEQLGTVGAWVGISGSEYKVLAQRRGAEAISPYIGTGTHPATAAGRLAYTFGLEGPAVAVDTACSSGLVALHQAVQALRHGEVDAALVGAVNVLLDPEAHVSMAAMGTLSRRGACHSWSSHADGYVRSEGCVVLLLTRRDDLPRLATIRGSAANQDGRSSGLTAPRRQAQVAVLRAQIRLDDTIRATSANLEEVRRLIKSQELKSMAAVHQELGWKTSCGCHVCRPALNFYLLADWPVEYQDDPQSRFINERKHANIQKDGTYSVVPRMWGGMTTPDELRAIADAAEKYNVPTVHVTGGQRIDLLGVKGEDLPDIWADLNKAGMVSGHAYAKGLRTVKTCVGKDHCRFGTQDSTGLGIKLEKILWGSWTPHKVKLGVSGCPRNCAEATCKDIGVVCVDSGYQIGVAGAAGMDVKETERLADVASEQEAIDLTIAFMQLFRENAKYLDRPYKWVAKVGLDWVKERVVDDLAERARLIEAFELSQSIYRKDPWAEHVAEKASRYAPLADLTLEAAE